MCALDEYYIKANPMIVETQVTKLVLTELEGLDPVGVFAEDCGTGKGRITIICYSKAWTSYWGGMGDRTIREFFCSCDEHYIAKNLSAMASTVYDRDALEDQAKVKGIDIYRDDPWNDYDFMEAMFGAEMSEWQSALPEKENHEYAYLCRIIKAVQGAFAEPAATG